MKLLSRFVRLQQFGCPQAAEVKVLKGWDALHCDAGHDAGHGLPVHKYSITSQALSGLSVPPQALECFFLVVVSFLNTSGVTKVLKKRHKV